MAGGGQVTLGETIIKGNARNRLDRSRENRNRAAFGASCQFVLHQNRSVKSDRN